MVVLHLLRLLSPLDPLIIHLVFLRICIFVYLLLPSLVVTTILSLITSFSNLALLLILLFLCFSHTLLLTVTGDPFLV